jgi:hypothetical protein
MIFKELSKFPFNMRYILLFNVNQRKRWTSNSVLHQLWMKFGPECMWSWQVRVLSISKQAGENYKAKQLKFSFIASLNTGEFEI